MASIFMPLTYLSAGKDAHISHPITLTVLQACAYMSMSRSTFYRRQKQRLEALQLIKAGANPKDFTSILAFPALLKEANGFGHTRSIVRHIDIIMWSRQLEGAQQ